MTPARFRSLVLLLASIGAGLITLHAAPAAAATRVLALQIEGDRLAPADRDALLQALQTLQNGAYMAKLKPKECTDALATVKKLAPKVKPKDDEDTQVESGPKNAYMTVATCLGRAGDCDQAWKVFKAEYPAQYTEGIKDEAQKETMMRSNFESFAQKCKEKKAPT